MEIPWLAAMVLRYRPRPSPGGRASHGWNLRILQGRELAVPHLAVSLPAKKHGPSRLVCTSLLPFFLSPAELLKATLGVSVNSALGPQSRALSSAYSWLATNAE